VCGSLTAEQREILAQVQLNHEFATHKSANCEKKFMATMAPHLEDGNYTYYETVLGREELLLLSTEESRLVPSSMAHLPNRLALPLLSQVPCRSSNTSAAADMRAAMRALALMAPGPHAATPPSPYASRSVTRAMSNIAQAASAADAVAAFLDAFGAGLGMTTADGDVSPGPPQTARTLMMAGLCR
jgi:hypothetical protein